MGPTADPVAGYLETFERLRARKPWTVDTATSRFAALALGSAGPAIDCDRLEGTADGLRKRARRWSPLKSEIRYVVAAIILRRGLDPEQIQSRMFEMRSAFKMRKIPSRGDGPTLAALLLALHAEGRPAPERQFDRLAAIYRRWRKDRFWLTTANDLPAAALHAGRDEAVETLTAGVERAYERLRAAGFRRGNALQRVSHLLAVAPRGVDTGAQRFCQIADRLRSARERVGTGRYDGIAALALTRETAQPTVNRVLEYRDRLRAAKPRPSKNAAFSLAAGIALAQGGSSAVERSVGDLVALQSIQATLAERQAAVVTAVSTGAAVSPGTH